MKLYILILLFVTSLIYCQEVPTDQQITNWWSSQTEQEKHEHLKRYLTIVNSTPDITFPDSVLVIDKKGTGFLTYQAPINIWIGDYLNYEFTIPNMQYKNVINYPSTLKIKLSWGSSGLVIGLGVGALLVYGLCTIFDN